MNICRDRIRPPIIPGFSTVSFNEKLKTLRNAGTPLRRNFTAGEDSVDVVGKPTHIQISFLGTTTGKGLRLCGR
jgi:hypothetical protein